MSRGTPAATAPLTAVGLREQGAGPDPVPPMLLPLWLLLLVSVAYLGLLFAVAWYGDRRPASPERLWRRRLAYGLTLGVYCTAWTFYAAVSTAATEGWNYLAIYLGPILLLLLGNGLYTRMLRLAKVHNITSIADFVGARFGKRGWLSGLVTAAVLVGLLPYAALQYKAVAFSARSLLGPPPDDVPAWMVDASLAAAVTIALFTILFGTRKVDATEHHPGLMLAIAFESAFKLAAFAAIAALAWRALPDGASLLSAGDDLPIRADQWLAPAFWAQCALAALGFFCLPRQFQVGVVECADTRDLRFGRWAMVAYLSAFALLVLPITHAAIRITPPSALPDDALVLWLTQVEGGKALMLIAFVGGVSAASGMVIVSNVAIAAMVSNELVMPALTRIRGLRLERREDLSRIVLWIRRLVIVLVAAAGYAYARGTGGQASLAHLGLVSLVAVVQVAPALLGGLLWRGASAAGAGAGLVAGFVVWMYCLFLPSLLSTHHSAQAWLHAGPLGLAELRPHALLGLDAFDPITHGLVWSLGVNLVLFVGVSWLRPPPLSARLRADAFLRSDPGWVPPEDDASLPAHVPVADLDALLSRIIGAEATRRAFEEYRLRSGPSAPASTVADLGLLRHAERILAAALGAKAARLVLISALQRRKGARIEEVVELLDAAGAELRVSRGMLEAMMNNVGHGISMIDADLRLMAWNDAYEKMFDYPSGMLYVGRPVADLIRYNIEQGGLGELSTREIEEELRKRETHLRSGAAYRFQRRRPSGQVVESYGIPMPNGGFVTSFSDVTHFIRVEDELRDLTERLEQRVIDRTDELQQALHRQRSAKQEAEHANASRNRLLAAASHDLLQPMNAARLFVSALRDHPRMDADAAELAERIDASLRAAEELLDGLLDLSRLESGVLQPDLRPVALAGLLDNLREQFQPLAERRGLRLRFRAPARAWVRSDPKLLRRLAQNLISNALRYTAAGGVLVGVCARAQTWELWVCDTGPGIPAGQQARVFDEFVRTDLSSPWGEKGLGLGLNICSRIAQLLAHPLRLQSRPGRGSGFGLVLPALPAQQAERAEPSLTPRGAGRLADVRVLCLDNERDILSGMQALLSRWGVKVHLAQTVDQALTVLRTHQVDAILADYRLDDGVSSMQALEAFRALSTAEIAIIAAAPDEAAVAEIERSGIALLHKPVKPAMLRAYLSSLARAGTAARTPRDAGE